MVKDTAAMRRCGRATPLLLPLLLLVVAQAAPAGGEAGGTTGAGYRHWQRDVHQKAEYHLDDFTAEDPRLAKKAGDVAADVEAASLTPKFRWTQDPRHVFLTVLVKNLDFAAAGAVQHDRWWLNFTASGDFQRTVGARHDSTEARAQGGKRQKYSLSLPLTRPVTADRTQRRASEGYTVFELRKGTPNSEWTHLVKEPARSLYKRHMRVDFKSKFDRDDENEDDDVWGSHEFKVERVTDGNVDDVISESGRIVILMFFPTWVHPHFSHYWAHAFASAAQAMEGRATLAVVNGLAESAVPVIKRFKVKLSQADGNGSRPIYRVFVDGGKIIPEGYNGENDAQQLVDFVTRLEGVCDDTPCPAVHKLVAEADLELLMGRHELSAIAVGMKESDALQGALTNITRSLQALNPPPYTARAKGVGVGWCGGGPAFNMLSTQLKGMPEIDLQDVDFPAILLVRVPGAPDGSDAGMTPPIMTTAASVIRPADGKKFKKAELKAAIGGWGFKQQGIVTEGGLGHVQLAAACGVSTAVLALGTEAEAVEATDDSDSGTAASVEADENQLALEGLRAFNSDNRSAPLQALVHRAHDQRGADAIRRLSDKYGWSPARVPALAIVRGEKLYAYPTSKYGELSLETIRKFAKDVAANKGMKSALRSEKASSAKGPGSGEVDRVVANAVRVFLDQPDLDRVLAVYDSTDELSEKRRQSTGKVAGKMSHVSTLAFGALDMSKNDIPPMLAKLLGGDPKRYEGVWLFKAAAGGGGGGGGGDGEEDNIGERCKRKASTKELASWVQKRAVIQFPAKVPALPSGPYNETCRDCRVMSVREVVKLRCKHCDGGSATQLMTEADLSTCAAFTNLGGELGCAEAAAAAADLSADGNSEGKGEL